MIVRKAGPAFWDRLQHEIEGDAAGDLFTRGRFATDASMYQCFPAGVVCPKTQSDVAIAIEMAREEGLSVIARGGGTSTAGQALGEGLVLDFSKYLNAVVAIDAEARACTVEPGCTLATLQNALDAEGLFLPVEIASAAQATLGGMLGNNSSGLRAMRYGSMRDLILSADTVLADGQRILFRPVGETAFPGRERLLDLLQFGEEHANAIAKFWPLRAAGEPEPAAYDLRAVLPYSEARNPARLLAGAEGTLAVATRIELKLAKRPENRALGICRFDGLGRALRLVAKIVALNPSAIEVLDKTMIGCLGAFATSDQQAARLLRGEPGALLIVEFDEANPVDNTKLLKALADLVGEIDKGRFPIVEIVGEKARASLWRLREAALRRAFDRGPGEAPLSMLDDAAVPLYRLAAYGADLEALLARHGVASALYGQAGRGCLRVRPMLDLRSAQDRALMRTLVDEMTALIRDHEGVVSAGRGLGLARSEALERTLPRDALALLHDLKTLLDPGFLLNPGKILRAPRFDDEAILRVTREAPQASNEAAPDEAAPTSPSLFWGEGSQSALDHALRCSGLGHCRSAEHGFTCPSYAVTGDEREAPRGRANVMRLALSGQLGESMLVNEQQMERDFRRGVLASPLMREAMASCVSCKACRTACPSGIDIPKLKVETLAAARAAGWSSRALDLFARLPDYTERARRWRYLFALRDGLSGLARRSERRFGFAADRPWPRWSGRRVALPASAEPGRAGVVALFADTFNRSFEPANLRAAAAVLHAAGYAVVAFRDEDAAPLCCGRTFYDAGYIEEARARAERLLKACAAFAEQGIPVIGLEPACVLMLRDEYRNLGLTVPPPPPILLFEEFLAQADGLAALPLNAVEAELVLHPHCHERAQGLNHWAEIVLKPIPRLTIRPAPATCCGLNGWVGLTPDTLDASLAMAELALFPAIREAGRDALVAATAYSCRKQIHDGLGITARHPAAILELALKGEADIVA